MDGFTGVNGAALVLRIAAGAILMAHGLPKLPGLSGGRVGRRKLVDDIASLGLPRPDLWATGVAGLQGVGGVCLLVGLYTSAVAAALALVMAAAVFVKRTEGFVLGADFPFALLCALLALVMIGDGGFSVMSLLGR